MFKTSHVKLLSLLTLAVLSAMMFTDNMAVTTVSFNSAPTPLPHTIKQAKIPVLMYHYVDNITGKEDGKYNLNTLPYVFEQQVVTLLDAGYQFTTPSELPVALHNSQQKYVIISFDDGYDDFYFNVYPLLQKYNIKAVNYVMPGFLGRNLHLNKNQISEMLASGLVEIGAHTVNHASLPSLQSEDAFKEIKQSKQMLDEMFSINVTSFAYPYGRYNAQTIEMVKESGFTSAVVTEEGNVISEDNLFEIKRIRPGINTGLNLLYIIEQDY